jgi:hypothetical protein
MGVNNIMTKKITNAEFKERAALKHNNKYDYSLTDYTNNKTKIKIICPTHGEFEQSPPNHLNGNGCKKCFNDRDKSNTTEFINKATKLHNNFYIYSKVNYEKSSKKVTIICPIHGDFEQIPRSHLLGFGCKKCSNLKKTSTDFIDRASKIHNNFYDYSKVKYVKSCLKVIITCPIHGDFEQTPNGHLKKQGCPDCANENKNCSNAEFINKASKLHNNFYTYSKVKYVGSFTKVIITCPKHGDFEQRPSDHLYGAGCINCQHENSSLFLRLPLKQFLKVSNEVHNNKYNYSLVEYVNSYTKIKIICPKHGKFEQTPTHHMRGSGCPRCSKKISKGEQIIINFLNKNNITFSFDKPLYLTNNNAPKNKFRYDFYLPQFNCLIEYDGAHHFKPVNFTGNISNEKILENFEKRKSNDQIKNKYAIENGYKLFRIPYTQFNNLVQILDVELKTNFSNHFSPYFVQALE